MGIISSLFDLGGSIASSKISANAALKASQINAEAIKYANNQNVALQRETNAQQQSNWEQERYDSQHELDYRIDALRRNGYSTADPSMAGTVNAPSSPQLTAPQVSPAATADPAAFSGAKGLSDFFAKAQNIETTMLQQDLLSEEVKEKEIRNSWLEKVLDSKVDSTQSQSDWFRSQTERNDKQAEYESRMFPFLMRQASADIEQKLASAKLTKEQIAKISPEIDKLKKETELLQKEVSTYDDYRRAQYSALLAQVQKTYVETQHLSQQQKVRAMEAAITVLEKRGEINGQSASMVKNVFRSAYNIKASLSGNPTAVDIFDAVVSPILLGITSSVP